MLFLTTPRKTHLVVRDLVNLYSTEFVSVTDGAKSARAVYNHTVQFSVVRCRPYQESAIPQQSYTPTPATSAKADQNDRPPPFQRIGRATSHGK